jgi:type VI secretion system secreted protein VgrG
MAVATKANQEKFIFLCNDSPENQFSVLKFTGKDSVASLYSFDISLFSKDHSLNENDYIGKSATLFIDRDGSMFPYTGMITEFSYITTSVDYSIYNVILKPKFWKLTLTCQSRIFQKISVVDIIKSVLDEHGLSTCYELKVSPGSYAAKEYVVQYNETDLNFISRLMNANGIWYYFQNTPVERNKINSRIMEKCVITDSSDAVKPISEKSKIIYLSQCGLEMIEESKTLEQIAELEITHRLIPEKAAVKSYNYRTPEVNLSAYADVNADGHGMVYEYGGNFSNDSEAQKCARLLASRLRCKKTMIRGKSNCTGLSSGKKIEIEEHQRESGEKKVISTELIITEVIHSGTTLSGYSDNMHGYDNSFKALPFANVADFKPACDCHKVIIPGVISAKVEGQGSQYASIDETGRYKVRMSFDRSSTGNSEGSKYIRMAQPYSGPGYGMHCPLHENTEVILAHVNSDPDKPLGLGSVPDASTMTPVKSDNKHQSMLKTAGNNELILDDTDGAQKFTMSTPYDQSFSAGNNQSISVSANRSVDVKNNESKDIAGNDELKIGANQEVTISGDKSEAVTGTLSLEISGNKNETCAAEKCTEVLSSESKAVNGTRTVVVTSDCGLSVNATHTVEVSGNHTVNAGDSVGLESDALVTIQASGNVTVKGANTFLSGKASINIVAGASTIAITPGSISILAPQVTLSGAEISMGASAVNMLMGGVIKIN